jgi:hypothetical protein
MFIPDERALALEPSFQQYQQKIRELVFSTSAVPDNIQQELKKVYDLLEICYFKYDLFDLAQLYAVMVFEKAMRLRLVSEYKNISKIKLSVLLDRAKQLNLLHPEQVQVLRALKDFRNKEVHVASEPTDTLQVLENIKALHQATEQIFQESQTSSC